MRHSRWRDSMFVVVTTNGGWGWKVWMTTTRHSGVRFYFTLTSPPAQLQPVVFANAGEKNRK